VTLHYFIGNLGHLLVIASFVMALVSAFSYLKATHSKDLHDRQRWLMNARTAFWIHSVAVVGIASVLFTIIYQHYFEYHYAYAHSSRHLPGQYMISCFWEGQEGSFLLWMFWQSVLGLILIYTQKSWEAPVMVVFSTVQGFLASMILGIVIPLIHVKIGSSPFILLRDAMHDPIFKIQPDFIPADGNGLNPLLQNYWMVIHPPTLFLGFALTLVPFGFCVAGLWQKRYVDWIKPSLPWALACGAILGVGILMGGYWAYETLSFGGYWNWDPVENAVYVPWLILIASIHTMMTYKNSGTALKASIILVIAVFILILYSTFLTRSGILGDASVHSFTDLGLSGQLLIYLLFFVVAAIALCIIRWKQIPSSNKEISAYSREFWIFIGAAVLCLMGFHVLVPTSFPVINAVAEKIGLSPSLAVPGNQLKYYSQVQIWFAIAVAIISGTGQFFWWTKMDPAKVKQAFLFPVLITLVLWVAVIVWGPITNPSYMILALAGIYIIVSNVKVLTGVLKVKPTLSGGAVAHIGIGLMLIGMMFSSGYSTVVSLNNTGLMYRKEAGTEFNRDNLLLFLNETRSMGGYDIEWLGERYEFRHKSGYVRKKDVELTGDPYKVIAKKEILFNGKKRYNAKDTFEIYPENTYYEIQLRKNKKIAATLYPRVQINPAMGGFLASPDIARNLTSDLYTHVSAPMDPNSDADWGKQEEVTVTLGKKFYINDYVAVLEEVKRLDQVPGLAMGKEDVAVMARIKVAGEHEEYYAEPIFLIRGRSDIRSYPDEVKDLSIKITLLNIHPATNEFTFALNARQKDFVIIKALEKPFINVLWLGTGILVIGFAVAMVRRVKEGISF
jgi:cytochrome c-type biogenesis protein CcmF